MNLQMIISCCDDHAVFKYIYFIGLSAPLAGCMNKRRNPPFTYFATAQHLP